MLTKEQNAILDLFKPKKSEHLAQEDYDLMGLYGRGYCEFGYEDEDEEEEEDYDE